jgi:hypothetical protein
LLALLLCVLLVGIVVFIYMLIVKPDGTLTVTYELRAAEAEIPEPAPSATQPTERSYKRCPACAEDVFAEAVVCRFCGHQCVSTPPAEE